VKSYWKLIGEIVTIFSVPLVIFTILFALKLDAIINWNYWIIFSPLLLLLLLSLLLSTSQKLSSPAPPQVRVTWILWIVSVTTFVVLLIMKLESTTSLNLVEIFIPLYVIAGIVFLSGFYVAFIGCCMKDTQQQKRKYILSGTPLFIFGIIFFPLVFLISFKEGVDFHINVSWAVVCIPLFVADGFCFCMGFFLLLFSFGGQKDALFTLPQLFIFLALIPVSVVFKVLLIMKLDGVLNIAMVYVFIPLIVLELLFFGCGITVAFGSNKQSKNKYRQVSTQS